MQSIESFRYLFVWNARSEQNFWCWQVFWYLLTAHLSKDYIFSTAVITSDTKQQFTQQFTELPRNSLSVTKLAWQDPLSSKSLPLQKHYSTHEREIDKYRWIPFFMFLHDTLLESKLIIKLCGKNKNICSKHIHRIDTRFSRKLFVQHHIKKAL